MRRSRGRSTSRFLRLCVRAPRMLMVSIEPANIPHLMHPASPLILVAFAAASGLYAGELHAQHHHHHPVDPPAEAPTLELMPARDASGTAWQPDGSPHGGNHAEWGAWTL